MRSYLYIFLVILISACSKPVELKPITPQVGQGQEPGPTVLSEFDFTGQENLGRLIFHDTRLSEPAGVSCASCHDASLAFTGNNGSSIPAVAIGSTPGSFGSRSVPQLKYAAFFVDFGFYPANDLPGQPITLLPFGGMFWDGRALDFAEQVRGPLLNPKEMNNPTIDAVMAKIETAPYRDQFLEICGSQVFGDTPKAFSCLSDAVAAFELSPVFRPFTSKFDYYLQGKAELTPLEAQGFELFKDAEKGNCISCHRGKLDSNYPLSWQFTDHGYDSIGTPRNNTIPVNSDPTHFDLGLCQRPGIQEFLPHGEVAENYCTQFKNPSLRNIALTAPYGHNGFFQTLTDIVKFYATRDTNPELWYPKDANGIVLKFDDSPAQYHGIINVLPPFDLHQGDTPRLNDAEIAAIVAFLETLTDGYSR